MMPFVIKLVRRMFAFFSHEPSDLTKITTALGFQNFSCFQRLSNVPLTEPCPLDLRPRFQKAWSEKEAIELPLPHFAIAKAR